MRRRVLVALGFVFLCFAREARAEKPWGRWRTIETPHFRVHFPSPFERWATRAAASLEAVNARVVEYIGFDPARRIDVIVSDPAADSNGLAYPFLDRPYIELWATPPDPEGGLGDFRDWTEELATHELAHIVHLTRPKNRAGWLERMLPLPIGPVFLNSPRWLAEGYATLVEGALTGSGRPSSTYRAMVLRRFAIEGKLPSYGALNGAGGWLGGSMAYLVGSSYLEWLEARRGPGSLRDLWKRMASRRGGGFAAAFRAVFGRSPVDLYDRFRAEVTQRALEQETPCRVGRPGRRGKMAAARGGHRLAAGESRRNAPRRPPRAEERRSASRGLDSRTERCREARARPA